VRINSALVPFRGRRAELAAKPEYVNEVLDDGAKRASVIARKTIKEVKQKMGLI
jgi:tryptophanyl-tRNA synthetase